MRHRFDLIVFDWDGTLADSEARIVGCLEASLRALQEPALPRAKLRSVIGLGLSQAFEALVPGRDSTTIASLTDAYRAAWLEGDAAAVRLFAGAADSLHALRSRGHRLAVATGKSRAGLDREMRRAGLTELFCASRCADEAPSKPHPRMLHDILGATATAAESALMIGDTDYDLRMAAAAGVASIAVTCGMHERARLEPCAPLAFLADVAALPAWLDGALE